MNEDDLSQARVLVLWMLAFFGALSSTALVTGLSLANHRSCGEILDLAWRAPTILSALAAASLLLAARSGPSGRTFLRSYGVLTFLGALASRFLTPFWC